jgi:hypothetical protein
MAVLFYPRIGHVGSSLRAAIGHRQSDESILETWIGLGHPFPLLASPGNVFAVVELQQMKTSHHRFLHRPASQEGNLLVIGIFDA